MIRPCTTNDFAAIHAIINEAAQKYRGIIPADRWKEPYMSEDELRHEIGQGVQFWGFDRDGTLAGVMGIQPVDDVTLIRHAYVRPSAQKSGIGGALLEFLRGQTGRPVLIGTWKDASWAIAFYEKHGFCVTSEQQKNRLLRTYWTIPARQVETSVVLAEKTSPFAPC